MSRAYSWQVFLLLQKFLNGFHEWLVMLDLADFYFSFPASGDSCDILEKVFPKCDDSPFDVQRMLHLEKFFDDIVQLFPSWHTKLFQLFIIEIASNHQIQMFENDVFFLINCRNMRRKDPRISDSGLTDHDAIQIFLR